MSLVIDGDRSLRRIHIGKKLLSLVEMLGIPTKTVIRDGFRIKAWSDSGLSKIYVKAPMGAAVVCSTNAGMVVLTADNWLSEFTQPRDLFVGDNDLEAEKALSIWYPANAVVENTKFLPLELSTLGTPNVPAIPTLRATYAEMFWIGVRAVTTTKNIFEHCRNIYADAGKGSKRFGILQVYASQLFNMASQIMPALSGGRSVEHGGYYFYIGDLVCAHEGHMTESALLAHNFILGKDLIAGMPSFLQDKFLGFDEFGLPQETTEGAPFGSYAYAEALDAQVIFLHGANFKEPMPFALNDYFASNPAEKKWQLWFSILKDGVTYTYSSEQFISVLDSAVDGGIIDAGVVDYAKAKAALRQLFPRPNYHDTVPHDSVMFHGQDETALDRDEYNIYTWTRKYGAFKFSTQGLSQKTLIMPQEVSDNPATRPDITYAGNFMYLCVCTKDGTTVADQTTGIKGVYYGSPFSGWTQLPPAPLVHVRPVKVTQNEIVLLGVLKVYNSETMKDEYFFAHFEDGAWKQHGKLNVEITGQARWAACTFGEGGIVKDLSSYLTQPQILMQMPAPAYEAYSGVIP